MRRQELRAFIEQQLNEILELFSLKNQSYGSEKDAFFNFEETARRVFHDTSLYSLFRVLLTYVDKHHVALCNRGLDDPEVAERLRDIIVYCLIGLAMVSELERI